MKLIIDIPEETYQIIRDTQHLGDSGEATLENVLIRAVEDGEKYKTGYWKWISYQNSDYGDICCSECNCVIVECILLTDMTIWGKAYKYCPNCGAKMESEGKE